MNNQIKKINLNHSLIFFLFCNIFSLVTFFINDFTISPLICLLLILSIGVSHGSLDNMKGKKLFEFSKMAIDPIYRGKGFGNAMMQFAISFAKKQNWNKIILYSNTILKNSIHLYSKYGFIEVPIEPNIIYSRGNIKMELKLNFMLNYSDIIFRICIIFMLLY